MFVDLFLGSMLKLITILRDYIYQAYIMFVDLFLLGIDHCRPFPIFRAFSNIFFEHINCPLSGLILEPGKPRSED